MSDVKYCPGCGVIHDHPKDYTDENGCWHCGRIFMKTPEEKINDLQEEIKHAQFEMNLLRPKIMRHTELEEPALFRNYNKHAARIVNAELEIQKIKDALPENIEAAKPTKEEDY